MYFVLKTQTNNAFLRDCEYLCSFILSLDNVRVVFDLIILSKLLKIIKKKFNFYEQNQCEKKLIIGPLWPSCEVRNIFIWNTTTKLISIYKCIND